MRGSALPRPLLSAVCGLLPAFSIPHLPSVCPDPASSLLLLPHLPPLPLPEARPTLFLLHLCPPPAALSPCPVAPSSPQAFTDHRGSPASGLL